jgi:hypothetical protein
MPPKDKKNLISNKPTTTVIIYDPYFAPSQLFLNASISAVTGLPARS